MAQRLQLALLRRSLSSVIDPTTTTTATVLRRILQRRRTYLSLSSATSSRVVVGASSSTSERYHRQTPQSPSSLLAIGCSTPTRWIHSTSLVEDKKADKKAAAEAKKAAKKAAMAAAASKEEDAKEETDEKKSKDDEKEPKEAAPPVDFEDDDDDFDQSDAEFANPRHFETRDFEKIYPEDYKDGEEMPPPTPIPPFITKEGEIPASQKLKDLTEEIVHLNMLEMNELVQKLADHFGFEDQPMMMMGGTAGGGDGDGGDGAEEAEAEKKTSFDVKLIGFDAKAKIKVIKEVRSLAELGLKEAKELVDNAPSAIKKDVSEDTANEMKAKIEAVGGQVEIE